ncbi:MAG: glycoside hydrolase family 2 protein [Chitinophagales bacterium]
MLVCLSAGAQKPIRITLDQNWQFRKQGDSTWLPAVVPGNVFTDLMRNGVIPDPFYADNESKVQWVGNANWEYVCSFELTKKEYNKKYVFITFEGLDTYTDVYINDSLVLHADNMFRSWHTEIRKYVHQGRNTIRVVFESAMQHARADSMQYPYPLPGDSRVFARKAQYQFGWDWGPRLVTAGIIQPITLLSTNNGYIQQSRYFYQNADSTDAKLLFGVQLDPLFDVWDHYHLRMYDLEKGKYVSKKNTNNNFQNVVYAGAEIQEPAVWSCTGEGEQNLYNYEYRLYKGWRLVDKEKISFGIPDIHLEQVADSIGSTFYFTVNGTKVFCKGANMIPLSSFPSEVRKAAYDSILHEAKELGINMIRIWGGGIYEDEYFYHACDSLGILVWQDMMFAGGMYPYASMEDNINFEVFEQLLRLRKHPCLALICGNNEIQEGWDNWGWRDSTVYSLEKMQTIEDDYKNLFEGFIESFTHFFNDEYNAPDYHITSPSIGWGHPESMTEGDSHYWGVWWGEEPFEVFNEKVPRFMSEYGFQGMASPFLWEKYIPGFSDSASAASVLQDPVMRVHQKHPRGFDLIQHYMEMYYRVPQRIDDFIYVSQILQADAMRTAIEAQRRSMPYCMGTLFWQLNDCWPVNSWSVIDYAGNRKAAYYMVKRKYADVMLSITSDSTTSDAIYIVNDRADTLHATLELNFLTTTDTISQFRNMQLDIAPHAVYLLEWKASLFWDLNNLLSARIIEDDSCIASETRSFYAPKMVDWQDPQITIHCDPETHAITLRSKRFAKSVYLYSLSGECKLSDNYFDLLPNIPVTIQVESGWTDDLPETLQYKCLNTIYGN